MSSNLSRRGLIGTSIGASALLASSTALSSPAVLTENSSRVVSIMDPPYNCDPTGQNNCAPAVQGLLDFFMSVGGGEMIVPPGWFRMDYPCSAQGCSITIRGSGKALSVFLLKHAGVGITVTCTNPYQSAEAHDIGFSPNPAGGGLAGVGLSLIFPNVNDGWSHSSVSDVDFGVATPGYTAFSEGLRLTNSWRGNYENINMHTNHLLPGSGMITLNGVCIDNHIVNCFSDNTDFGIDVRGYTEGLTLQNTVLIANQGFSTGTANYNNGINLLGLYITNCEISCYVNAASLFQVTGGCISGTHFGSKTSGTPAALLTNCQSLQLISNCFSGEMDPQNPAPYTGLQVSNCSACQIDNNQFTNLLTGLLYTHGSLVCTSTGTRMIAPGGSGLVGQSYQIGSQYISAVQDNSGNETNFAQWISDQGIFTSPNRGKARRARAGDPRLVAGIR